MRKTRMKAVRIAAIILCFVMVAASALFFSDESAVYAAGKEIKMTAYDKVMKRGNTVYCAGAKGLYKVKLKNGRVKSKKVLRRAGRPMFGAYTYLGNMKKRGNYIYYTHGSEGTMWQIFRTHIKTGKTQKVGGFNEQVYWGYVIKGKKVYYNDGDYETYSTDVISRTLSGKFVKHVNVVPIMKNKNSNQKGYTVVIKKRGNYARDYLRTPKGTFYLGKAKIEYPY